jgi:DNA-binding transcriptional LysR family regulator
MRSEQLIYVAAIARLGSYRRAADELHISQPALTATVRNLERELGVRLLERGRSGAQVSDQGRELLPHIGTAIEAIDRLRRAADQQHRTTRVIRVGTVNAATAPLLTQVIARFNGLHRETEVQIVGAQEAVIQTALRDGNFDVGLITQMEGDDAVPDLETTLLLRGHAVVVMPPDHPLTRQQAISPGLLAKEPLIMMRAGYLMHRYLHRLLDGVTPDVTYSTDGAEMGKLMVAERLGICVLPSFSVTGDPLIREGILTWRPLTDDAEVQLALQRRRSAIHPETAQDLYRLFTEAASEQDTAKDLQAA